MRKILLLLITFTTFLVASDWEKAEPTADKYDWIQTTSGEWLKGEVKGMYNDKIEFDSDEFDIQHIDFDDVKQLKSHSTVSLNVDGKGDLEGKLYIKDEAITLITSEGNTSINKTDIISFTHGANEESSYWSGKISAGVSKNSGNTDKSEFNIKGELKRQTSLTRLTANYLGNYGKSDGVETENNHRFHTNFDIFQTRNFFWRPVFAEYYRDPFQNIAQKYTYAIGVGYDVYSTSKTNWTLFSGPAIQTTKFVAVQDDEDDRETTGAFIFTSKYDHELTSNIDLIMSYQAYIVNKRSGKYIHHALITIETELINDFNLDFTFIWDRVQNPVASSDGDLPKKNDYKTIFSLGYSF